MILRRLKLNDLNDINMTFKHRLELNKCVTNNEAEYKFLRAALK